MWSAFLYCMSVCPLAYSKNCMIDQTSLNCLCMLSVAVYRSSYDTVHCNVSSELIDLTAVVMSFQVAAWFSSSTSLSISKVTLRRTWLVLGWVTIFGRNTNSVITSCLSQPNLLPSVGREISTGQKGSGGLWLGGKSSHLFVQITTGTPSSYRERRNRCCDDKPTPLTHNYAPSLVGQSLRVCVSLYCPSPPHFS